MPKQRRPQRNSPSRPSTSAADGLRPGELVEVEIERIVPGGLGLAHAAGKTLFVALAVPGDVVRARVERVRGAVVFASVAEIIKPGPERVEPPCPYFGRCGGCDFQQLTYDAQLRAKADIIRDCLQRIAHLQPPNEIRVEPSPAAWRYRARARWQWDAQRRQLGYYELASHRVCDVAACPVVVPAIEARLETLRAALVNGEDEGGAPHDAREFQAVAGDDGVSLLPPFDGQDAGERTLRINDEIYRFDADCFFQINHALLPALVACALGERSEIDANSHALDLYSGVGLFTLPLARRFAHVAAVEGHAAACDYARRNLADAGLKHAEVHTARVGAWLAEHAATLAPVELVLLDPPRAGAEPDTLEALLRLRSRRITYVSCDPATLARDLRLFVGGGYRLDSLTGFDMFPQTHHVETVAQLVREVAAASS